MLKAKWTIALWVVLILLFVASYQYFSGAKGAAPAPPPSAEVALFARWLPVVMAGLFLVLFAVFFVIARRRQARHQEGMRMLTQGRYVQALEAFEEYRRAHPRHAAASFNCGVTRLCLWKIEGALRDFESTQKLFTQQFAVLAALLPEHLAMTHALMGRTGDARKQLNLIPAEQGDPGRIALVTAILLAREGQWAPARGKLDTFEVRHMSGTVGALARAVDAFCIEQLTLERRHIDRVALFGEVSPDELEKHWPELVAFVERAPAW